MLLHRQPSIDSNASSTLATVASFPSPGASVVSRTSATTTSTTSITNHAGAYPSRAETPVLCLFDWSSSDPDHISFSQGDMLVIVHQLASGWWAAQVNDRIGWVPKDYLKPLTHKLAVILRGVPPSERFNEYKAFTGSWPNGEPDSPILDTSAVPTLANNQNNQSNGFSDKRTRLIIPETPFVTQEEFEDEEEESMPAYQPGVSPISPPEYSEDDQYSPYNTLPPQSIDETATYTSSEPTKAPLPTSQSLRVVNQPQARRSLNRAHSLNASKGRQLPIAGPVQYPVHPTQPSNTYFAQFQQQQPARPTYPLRSETLPLNVQYGTFIQGTPVHRSHSAQATGPSNFKTKNRDSTNTASTSASGSTTLSANPATSATDGSPSVQHHLSMLFERQAVLADYTEEVVSVESPANGPASGATGGYWSRLGLNNAVAGSSSSARSPAALGKARAPVDEDAQAYQNALIAQASQPWFLQPSYGSGEIKLDRDGTIIAGTVPALVERLTIDPLKMTQEQGYRKAFLTTFKSFTTPQDLLEMLIFMYQAEVPSELDEAESLEWREKRQRPTQTRILSVLTYWVEKHGLMIDDGVLAPRLREFLGTITSPSNALSARLLLQTMDKIQQYKSINPDGPSPTSATFLEKHAKKKFKSHKSDFLKCDPSDLANQLTLMESRAYNKIRPVECLNFPKAKSMGAIGVGGSSGAEGKEGIANLSAFCAMNDKLAAWVKLSILSNDGLGKRADTIDHWIKVAERLRSQNNISSLSAIVAALSGADVGRLRLTWNHVSRGTHLEPLQKLTEPSGNFGNYRKLHKESNGPCVPYIATFLTDLVHINDNMTDNVIYEAQQPQASTSTAPYPIPSQRTLINFTKRQRTCDIIWQILKFQPIPSFSPNSTGSSSSLSSIGSGTSGTKQYQIKESPSLMTFIETQLMLAAGKDQGFFWQRSQDLQSAEVAHADIRKGLEAAGF